MVRNYINYYMFFVILVKIVFRFLYKYIVLFCRIMFIDVYSENLWLCVDWIYDFG